MALLGVRGLLLIFAVMAVTAITGCGADIAVGISQPVQAVAPDGLSGQVRSGTQAVVNAQVFLYSAGTSGIASASRSLLTAEVFSDQSGNFNLANDYTCSAGQQLYLVAIGGKTDKGVNPNTSLMATLGDCATINDSTFAVVNELTTVASVFALAPFMNSYEEIGSAQANAKGLASAFATVAKLANIAKGSAGGPALPANASFDSSKLNTLADVIVPCVQSTGGKSGDGSPCGQLFSLVASVGGTSSTDTIGAALRVAKNPASATGLFALGQTDAPFTPQLAVAPADWTLAITYRNGAFNKPSCTTVDRDGSIWVANAGNNTVSVMAQSGMPTFDPLSGNNLNRPVAIAIDAGGQAWVVNNGGASVSIFQADGEVGSIPNAVVGSEPTAIAVDPIGSIWVANSGSNTLTKLSMTGALIKTVSSQVDLPSGIAINTK